MKSAAVCHSDEYSHYHALLVYVAVLYGVLSSDFSYSLKYLLPS